MTRPIWILALLTCALASAGCGGAAQSYGDSSMSRGPDGLAMGKDGASAITGISNATKAERKLTRDARLTLEVDDEDEIEPTLNQIAALAAPLEGYVVRQSSRDVSIKVPATQLDGVLKQIEGFGEITRRQVNTRDVTSQHADLKVRLDNLITLQKRLRELADQGQSVSEILEVEKELSRVTGELERLQGQMKLLNNQIDFSTVTVRVEESVSPGPVGWVFYGLYRGVKWLFVWD